jgi:hypothetical protein
LKPKQTLRGTKDNWRPVKAPSSHKWSSYNLQSLNFNTSFRRVTESLKQQEQVGTMNKIFNIHSMCTCICTVIKVCCLCRVATSNQAVTEELQKQ